MTNLQTTNHTAALATYSSELTKWQEAIAKRVVPKAISSKEDLAETQAWINAAKKRLKELEDFRKAATTPLDDLKKAIMQTEKDAAAPLLADMEAVSRLQKEYTDAIERKELEASIARNAKRKLLQQAEEEVREVFRKVTTRIRDWESLEQAEAALPALQGFTPKASADVQADADALAAFGSEWSKAKPSLITYAQERITALRAGATVEITPPVANVDTSMEQLAVMADSTPEVQLKNVRKVLVPVVSFPCDLAALVQAALDGGYKREKLMEVLQGMAAKVAPGTAIRGVQWKEETKIINK